MITKMLYQPVKGTYKFKQSPQPISYQNHLENVPKGNKPAHVGKIHQQLRILKQII